MWTTRQILKLVAEIDQETWWIEAKNEAIEESRIQDLIRVIFHERETEKVGYTHYKTESYRGHAGPRV